MSKRLMKFILKAYFFFKHRVQDILWGEHPHRVPLATAIGGFIWLIIEPGPEPSVVLITSLLAISVSKKEKSDFWYTKTQGNLYLIKFRADTLSLEERVALAKSFVSEIDFVCKYKVVPEKGDSLSKLYVDTLTSDDISMVEQARKHFVLYFITRDGKEIYDKYDQEYQDAI